VGRCILQSFTVSSRGVGLVRNVAWKRTQEIIVGRALTKRFLQKLTRFRKPILPIGSKVNAIF
jgi:hypothetical protein